MIIAVDFDGAIVAHRCGNYIYGAPQGGAVWKNDKT